MNLPAVAPPGFTWTPEDHDFCRSLFKSSTWQKMIIRAGMNRPKVDKTSTETRAMSSAEAEGWEGALGFLMEHINLEVDIPNLDDDFSQPDMSQFNSKTRETNAYDSRKENPATKN